MNNKGLITELSKRLDVTQKVATDMLESVTSTIVKNVAADNVVQLQGLGTFELRKKQDRMLVHPSTGKQMVIPPKLTIVFKPSETYKNKVK